MSIQNEGKKLRIYIYGKNALSNIDFLNKKISSNLTKIGDNIFKANEKKSNNEYYIIQGDINNENNNIIQKYLTDNYQKEDLTKANEIMGGLIKKYSNDLFNDSLEEEISKVLTSYRKFYDVILISVDNLLDEESKLAFNFFQGFSELRGSQPFIFFLTKKEEKPNIQNLFPLVTNEFFDKRNVYAFKFPTNDEELQIINNHLYECRSYYHEEGNGDSDEITHSFNILICGRAGVGKSSFINQLLQKKVAKEGEGLSVTHKISKYVNKKYHIKLYDTPGFEDDDTVDMVFKAINTFEESVSESKNHLDLILYFSKVDERTIYNCEKRLLINLINKKKKIIFVINDHGNLDKKKKERYIGLWKTSLTQIVNEQKNNEKSNEKIDLDNLFNNILIVKLRQSIEEVDDNEYKIRQCYGLDELFKKIYNMFEKERVDIYTIKNAENIDILKSNISYYDVLKNIQSKEDVQINTKINCSKEILSKAKYDWFIWFGRDKRRKKLLEFINKTYNTKSIDNYDNLLKDLKDELNKLKNKKEEVANFFSGIEKFKNSFKTDGFNFNAYFYNEKTLLIGYLYLKQFKSELGEYDDIFKNFILELCMAFNESIEGFKKLENDWKKVYESLKDHKSNQEWVNQFFFVDIPKNNEQ